MKAAEMTTGPREVAADLSSREEDTTMTRMHLKRVGLEADIRDLPATTEVAREVALEAATEAAIEVATDPTEAMARDIGTTPPMKAYNKLADSTIEVAAVATTETEMHHPDKEAKADIALITLTQGLLTKNKTHSRMSSLKLKGIPEEALTFCTTTTEVA